MSTPAQQIERNGGLTDEVLYKHAQFKRQNCRHVADNMKVNIAKSKRVRVGQERNASRTSCLDADGRDGFELVMT